MYVQVRLLSDRLLQLDRRNVILALGSSRFRIPALKDRLLFVLVFEFSSTNKYLKLGEACSATFKVSNKLINSNPKLPSISFTSINVVTDLVLQLRLYLYCKCTASPSENITMKHCGYRNNFFRIVSNPLRNPN